MAKVPQSVQIVAHEKGLQAKVNLVIELIGAVDLNKFTSNCRHNELLQHPLNTTKERFAANYSGGGVRAEI